MWFDFERMRTPTLKNPTMVVAVSTSLQQYQAMYSQARELGEYMLRKMKFERIATIRASAFPPEVIVKDGGISTLPECHFYLNREKRDLVLFAGDTSPMDGQYEFATIILDYAVELGVKELYSVGARWAENPLPPDAEPEPNGFSTDRAGVEKLKKNGVKIVSEEPAPFFASMVVGMAKERGIRGYKLSVDHGEPSPHPRSVARLLGVLSAMSGFEAQLEESKASSEPSSPSNQTRDSTIYR
ncbi:MAG: PAC2 family protein [Nitrososphaerales archaeon]|jgi:proteasome assembly chaperone (PAC2) family protein